MNLVMAWKSSLVVSLLLLGGCGNLINPKENARETCQPFMNSGSDAEASFDALFIIFEEEKVNYSQADQLRVVMETCESFRYGCFTCLSAIVNAVYGDH